MLASVSSGGWSAESAGALAVLRFFRRGCCSETSLCVRVRTPFGRVLPDCVDSSDARLFFPAGFDTSGVALDAASSSSGVWVPFIGVLLPNEPFGEPESVDIRLRLAGSSSKSDGCATSFNELRRLPDAALDGAAGLV